MSNIKSYEEALNILGKEKPKHLNDMPKNEQSYHKLCTICDALNLGHKKEERIYYPWWINEDLHAGVEARYSAVGWSDADWPFGYRLCNFDRDTAIYLGSEPFVKFWQEYLL